MRIPRNETHREDYHHMHGRHLKRTFIRQVSVGVSAVGGLLLGLILGVIITLCYLRRCKVTHRKALRPKRGSYRVSSVESVSGINNRTYIYGMETGSAIYGTAATYLSEEDRKKLGMGKVVINVSTQTDPMRRSKTELPTRSKRIEDKVYDYCCSNDIPGQTYVVYQNVFQTHMSARRPSSTCPKEEEDYESPTWDAPEINMFHCNDETFTDDVFKGECKIATDNADDEDYIDPRLVNPKKKSTTTTKGRRPQKSKTSSSDSESDEKEMVDIQLKEYAHSLRVKRKTKRRDCRESVHWSPKKKSVTNGRQKSAKKGREKSGYMKMHLTPEMWEILKNHTDKMKAAKEAKESGSLSDEMRPRCSRGQLTRQQSVSNDEIYIDVIG